MSRLLAATTGSILHVMVKRESPGNLFPGVDITITTISCIVEHYG